VRQIGLILGIIRGITTAVGFAAGCVALTLAIQHVGGELVVAVE
jgi:hypothetical protein